MNIESLITDLAFILLLGAVTTVFFKRIKQPVVLGYIVAGFLASPNFKYLPSVTTDENIHFWAELGIVVLLFCLGLEFSFKKLINAGSSAAVTALIIVSGMMCVGLAIGHALGFTFINSLFLGGMLSMSSTTIIIKAFADLGLTRKKFASMVFAVLIVEDLFAVLMMVILSSIAVNNRVEGGEMLYSIAKLVFFLVIWFAVGVYVLPSAFNRIRRYLNSETLLVISMGLCLGMAVFSVYCGFSLALGAFVMGSILAGTSFAERIETVTRPVKDLFGAVFFISVGMMVQPAVIVQYLGPILLLSATVIAGMITFGTFGMLITGQPLRTAMESGFSLTQIGEFAFIIASLGMTLGVLDPSIYPIVVAVSVLTTFTTPYFIGMADPAYRMVERHLPKRYHFLIERYSTEATHDSATGELWRTVRTRYLWRMVLYTAVLITLCLLSTRWLLPHMLTLSHQWGRLITSLISIGAMAPFLLALTLPASKKTERRELRSAGNRFNVPLIIMTIFRLAITLGFLVYILGRIWSWSIGVTAGVAVFLFFLFVLSKRLRSTMKDIESRFINNLNERELRRSGRNNSVVSNLHLAYMTVEMGCSFVGKRLQESGVRERYGVNIASIQRGGTLIPVPAGDTRIFPADVIGVIGTDEAIQAMLADVESEAPHDEGETNPDDFRLTSLQLTGSSPLVGKTVAEADLSKRYSALLVSICRDNKYFMPEASTRFCQDDLLWIVGDRHKLRALQ